MVKTMPNFSKQMREIPAGAKLFRQMGEEASSHYEGAYLKTLYIFISKDRAIGRRDFDKSGICPDSSS